MSWWQVALQIVAGITPLAWLTGSFLWGNYVKNAQQEAIAALKQALDAKEIGEREAISALRQALDAKDVGARR